MKAVIRSMQPEEFPQLRDFLYLSIFVHQGETPPDRSVLDTPEVLVFLEGLGARPRDGALVAAVMDLRMRKALPAIAGGVVIAGLIIAALTYGVTALLPGA